MASVFEELKRSFSPASLDVRGENAHAVAVMFLEYLQEQIPDDEDRRKLMMTWMKSVRDKDYKKFQRALKRYHRKREAGD